MSADDMYDTSTRTRLAAWHRLAEHPFFADCYDSDEPLVDAMVAKLDGFEATVRARIAADITAWPDTPLGKDTLARGAWSDGVCRGLSIAADIAEATPAPEQPRRGLLARLRDLDRHPTDPPALSGLDDLDPDMAELLAARDRRSQP